MGEGLLIELRMTLADRSSKSPTLARVILIKAVPQNILSNMQSKSVEPFSKDPLVLDCLLLL